MKRTSKTVGTYVVVLVLGLVVLALYRAYLDNSSFPVSFDKLTKIIVNETWRVLSNPTVFLALLLALVLIAYRKQLSPLAPPLSEITFGSFTAKFSKQVDAEIEKGIKDTIATTPQNLPRLAESTKQEIVANLRGEFCLYLLQVANKPLPLMEHFRLVSQVVLDRRGDGEGLSAQMAALVHGVRTFEASGFFRALYQFNGLIFSYKFEKVGSDLHLLAKVDSDILDLIRRRVGKEPDGEERQGSRRSVNHPTA